MSGVQVQGDFEANTQARPLPVILDVDTGFDDALAILLALRAPQLDVRAITCVAGNHRLAQVVANTLKVLDAAGEDEIPVAGGMERALLEPHRAPMDLHGADGMADLDLPPAKREAASLHAVELMRTVVENASDPVTLIALAPLTNVAVFVRMYPQLARRLGAIVVMGGTLTDCGNTSPTAEFNIRCDPEAAAIVFGSGLPVRLYTLDVFMQISFSRREIEQFCRGMDRAAEMAGRILEFSCNHFGQDHALIGDAGTVAVVIQPELATWRTYPIGVELGGQWTRGQTVLDRRSPEDSTRLGEWYPAQESQVDVTEAVDVEGVRKLFARLMGVILAGEEGNA